MSDLGPHRSHDAMVEPPTTGDQYSLSFQNAQHSRILRATPLVAIVTTHLLLVLAIRPASCEAEVPPRPTFTQEKTAPPEEFLSLLREAAAGDARSQFELGTRYEYGLGIPRDYAQAVAWYTKAADQGLAEAQNNLGVMHSLGQGVPQDYSRAVVWYTRAAEQGLTRAQHTLGEMYRSGQGVPLDSVESLKWFGLEEAGATGDPKAELAELLSRLARTMTPDEVAEAQRRARAWLERITQLGSSARRLDLSALSALKGGFAASEVYRARPGAEGLVFPRLLHEEKPNYTAAALRAKIQGIVVLDCVVGIDGRVSRCEVVRSLDSSLGLDHKAIEAALQWRFLPGRKDGQPVPVLLTFEFTFSLRGK